MSFHITQFRCEMWCVGGGDCYCCSSASDGESVFREETQKSSRIHYYSPSKKVCKHLAYICVASCLTFH